MHEMRWGEGEGVQPVTRESALCGGGGFLPGMQEAVTGMGTCNLQFLRALYQVAAWPCAWIARLRCGVKTMAWTLKCGKPPEHTVGGGPLRASTSPIQGAVTCTFYQLMSFIHGAAAAAKERLVEGGLWGTSTSGCLTWGAGNRHVHCW